MQLNETCGVKHTANTQTVHEQYYTESKILVRSWYFSEALQLTLHSYILHKSLMWIPFRKKLDVMD